MYLWYLHNNMSSLKYLCLISNQAITKKKIQKCIKECTTFNTTNISVAPNSNIFFFILLISFLNLHSFIYLFILRSHSLFVSLSRFLIIILVEHCSKIDLREEINSFSLQFFFFIFLRDVKKKNIIKAITRFNMFNIHFFLLHFFLHFFFERCEFK